MTGRARQTAEELGLAFSLLTRLPVPRFEIRSGATLATAFWAYPVAGGVVALLSGSALWAGWAATGSALAAGLFAIAAGALATGGFHEDGLADFWDGIGGGADPERRLEIMRDSRLGTYGALGLFVALAARLVVLADLVERNGAGEAVAALVACGVLGRGAIALPFATLAPAREVGLAAQAKRPPTGSLAAGVALPLVVALPLLGGDVAAALLGAMAGSAAVTYLAGRYLGGYTGDVFGATVMTAEIVALLALLAVS